MRLTRNAVTLMMNDYGRFGNTDEPTISVVISAFNEEGKGYLNRSIESALDQGYAPSEVIVIDDGSTDGTADIAKKYSDRGVQVYSTENRGLALARNYGGELATSDIIVFNDADSCLQDGLLKKVADRIRKGYVGGTARSTPDTEGATESLIYGAANIVAGVTNFTSNFIDSEINRMSEGGFLYCRKDVFEAIKDKYGEPFPNGTSEDRAFAYRMSDEGPTSRITNVGITTSSRRVRQNGLIGSVIDQWKRSTTPAGIPHDGYPVIREDAALVAA
jgi:glycosyltransferase involved in cell wall biosynthesis